MNGKLDSAYSHHAACRMPQRGIDPEWVELLLGSGRSAYHQGREVVYLDRKGVAMLVKPSADCPHNAVMTTSSLSGPTRRRDCHRRA